jgi:hypothetical protein
MAQDVGPNSTKKRKEKEILEIKITVTSKGYLWCGP